MEKDIDLLKHDQADLLIITLSETAHRKWRGEGPKHQTRRRTGIDRFVRFLVPMDDLQGTDILTQNIDFEGQIWTVSSRRVIGLADSIMPGAEHVVTMCWRSEVESGVENPSQAQPSWELDSEAQGGNCSSGDVSWE